MNIIKTAHRALIDKVLQKAKEDDRVLSVVLFGSAVSKQNYRDIDLCIIPYDNADLPSMFKEYLYLIDDLIDIRFFPELPLYIQARVMKEGEILVQKDYDKLFHAYMAAIQRWDDFKPHFRTYLEAVKHG